MMGRIREYVLFGVYGSIEVLVVEVVSPIASRVYPR